jgi:cytochrome c553
MRKLVALLMTLLLTSWQLAWAEESFEITKSAKGYGSANYVWGELLPEQIDVQKLIRDVDRGKVAFRGCAGCHKANGAGLIDGTYPRLTGQHASVIIKQITEVRAGVRINPKMSPFSKEHAVTPQEIADISVFVSSAQTARENGKGDGTALDRGKQLYQNGCVKCHGDNGEGDSQKRYPAVSAQHYAYMVRQMDLIQKGIRGNSHPDMVLAVKNYTAQDTMAVADYMSRMPDYRTVSIAAK